MSGELEVDSRGHRRGRRRTQRSAALFLAGAFLGGGIMLQGVEPTERAIPAAFAGERSNWHGFDRYDYVIDTADLILRPFSRPTAEGTGVGSPRAGERRCIVVVPERPSAGRPWIWRGCYWDH